MRLQTAGDSRTRCRVSGKEGIAERILVQEGDADEFEKEPCGQFRQVVAPKSEYVPGLHAVVDKRERRTAT